MEACDDHKAISIFRHVEESVFYSQFNAEGVSFVYIKH